MLYDIYIYMCVCVCVCVRAKGIYTNYEFEALFNFQ